MFAATALLPPASVPTNGPGSWSALQPSKVLGTTVCVCAQTLALAVSKRQKAGTSALL